MQNSSTSAPGRRPAVQQGLIFGVIAGVVFAINSLLGNVANIGVAAGIIGIVLFLVGIFIYAAAGFRASAQTGKVVTGTLAGLLTGVVGGIIGLIVTIIIAIVDVNALRERSQAAADALHVSVHYTNALILSGSFIGAILGLAIAIGLGAAFGAIGGVIGKRRAPAPSQAYQESLYQGMPPSPAEQMMPYPPNPANPYDQPYNQPPQQNPSSDPYSQSYPPQQPPSSNSY